MASPDITPPSGRPKPRLKLGSALLLLFAFLSLPPLIFILAYGYQQNEAAIVTTLDRQMTRTTNQSVEAVSDLIGTVGNLMAILGDHVADDPAYFRTDPSYGFIWRNLVAARQIDALYVTFDDGYHRVVTRVDADRRRSNPQIPRDARWQANHIDAVAAGGSRVRHRRFFGAWPTPSGGNVDSPNEVDLRTLPFFVRAKALRTLVVNDPSISPDTGSPVLTMGWPVVHEGRFIGCVGANLTLHTVSAYLQANRVSPNSVTVIVDRSGHVIAHSDPAASMQVVAGHSEVTTVDRLRDRRVAEALTHPVAAGTSLVRFTSDSGEELSVARQPFPPKFGKDWEIVIVAPTRDFVGPLRATNREMVRIIALVIVLELGLIFVLARRLSQELEAISNQFTSVQALDFLAVPTRGSPIGEIADLQNGFSLLQNALGSFAKFVPLGVVRQFVSSGESITTGVEARQISILFCDLEGFTEQSEKLAPDDLLLQLTQYFSAVTSAVTQEGGTVDKFIGDAVMALWGAPTARDDHMLRACASALRAKRRMEALTTTWRAEGRPVMRVRIGLHMGEVLVGNIGSDDRLSYTAIGDGVNVSSRLEGVNKVFGTTICISDSIYAGLRDVLVVRPLRPITVKGRSQTLMVYELLGMAGTDDPEVAASRDAIELAQMSAEAVAQRLQGHLQASAELYRSILDRFPDDPASRLLLEEILADELIGR